MSKHTEEYRKRIRGVSLSGPEYAAVRAVVKAASPKQRETLWEVMVTRLESEPETPMSELILDFAYLLYCAVGALPHSDVGELIFQETDYGYPV